MIQTALFIVSWCMLMVLVAVIYYNIIKEMIEVKKELNNMERLLKEHKRCFK